MEHMTGKLQQMQLLQPRDPAHSPVSITVEGAAAPFHADWVINCSGPSLDYREGARQGSRDAGQQVIDRMVARGQVAPEATGVCLLVDVRSGRLLEGTKRALAPSRRLCESRPPVSACCLEVKNWIEPHCICKYPNL